VAGADRFYFCSGQHDARLKFFEQEVVMRSDPIDSGVSLSSRGWVAAWTLLRVGFGLVCGLARHSREKRYHIGRLSLVGVGWGKLRGPDPGGFPGLAGLRPKSVTADETVTSELARSDAIITLLPVYFWPTKATNSPQGRWSPPSSLHARND
jgi:hypothetical protein